MRKGFLRILISALLCFLVLVGSLRGFRAYRDAQIEKRMAELNETIRFGHFSQEEQVSESLPLEEVVAYRDVYANASAGFYEQTLDINGKAAYRAILYAFDHQYDYVELPSSTGSPEQLAACVNFVGLDHAMLEENCVVDAGTVLVRIGERETERCYLRLSGFTAERAEKKAEAFTAAEKVVSAMPEGTQAEQARWLYDWVVTHVTYTRVENYNDTSPHYLYDAMVGGSSNCDGISNAYTLLMNLAGLECFNVIDAPPEGEEGHTWNILVLDGNYYQADPTAEIGAYENLRQCFGLYFARSAAALGNGEYHERIREVAPPCTDTDRDREGVAVYCHSTALTAAEKEAIRQTVRRLESGADPVILGCDDFPKLSEQQRLDLVGEWVRPCYVDLIIYSFGEYYCVLCAEPS